MMEELSICRLSLRTDSRAPCLAGRTHLASTVIKYLKNHQLRAISRVFVIFSIECVILTFGP